MLHHFRAADAVAVVSGRALERLISRYDLPAHRVSQLIHHGREHVLLTSFASEQRAEEVKRYLMQQGMPSIAARGFGKTQPLVPNDSSGNRQKNRRVEMIVSGEFISVSSQSVSSTH